MGYARAGSNPAFGTTEIESNIKGLATIGWPLFVDAPMPVEPLLVSPYLRSVRTVKAQQSCAEMSTTVSVTRSR